MLVETENRSNLYAIGEGRAAGLIMFILQHGKLRGVFKFGFQSIQERSDSNSKGLVTTVVECVLLEYLELSPESLTLGRQEEI